MSSECTQKARQEHGTNCDNVAFLEKCSIFRLPVNLRSADRNEDV